MASKERIIAKVIIHFGFSYSMYTVQYIISENLTLEATVLRSTYEAVPEVNISSTHGYRGDVDKQR